MKKNITVAIFSLFFFSLFISPALAESELSNLTQQKSRVETLKQRIVTLIDLAESKNRNDVVSILQELLSSAENILGKIDNKVEDIFDGWNTYRDEDIGFEVKYPLTISGKNVLLENGKIIVAKNSIINPFVVNSSLNFAEIIFPSEELTMEGIDEWINLKQKEGGMIPFERCYKDVIYNFEVALCKKRVASAVPIYYEYKEYFLSSNQGVILLSSLVLESYSTDPLNEEKTKIDMSQEEIEDFYRIMRKIISTLKILD